MEKITGNGSSVAITILNEEKSISELLNSLLFQFTSPREIIIVDGGSKDRTVEIVRHLQKKDKRIKLLREKCSRARGRNLGVDIASNEIIAITDAGCIADKYWLERITAPFSKGKVDIVAGFYDMVGESDFQKVSSLFLGTTPEAFGPDFLPSTRSIAFTKEIWSRVGGFPEKLKGAAEDTVFTARALKAGARFARVKDARVEWRMPKDTAEFFNKVKGYAEGDLLSGIWYHPTKGLASHNIKASLVVARYLVGTILLIMGISNPSLLILLAVGILIYCLWAFRKVYMKFKDAKLGILGISAQFVSDFAIIAAFIEVLTKRNSG